MTAVTCVEHGLPMGDPPALEGFEMPGRGVSGGRRCAVLLSR
jgi:hypothetical protein